MHDATSADNQHLPPPRVLIVENDSIHRDVIASILRSPLYFVDFARDGFEGFEMALTRSYDVVLTDLRMPRMTGDEMVNNLRKHPQLLGHCQIAVMSTVPYDVAGVSAYLQKPFRGAELKNLIDAQAFIAFEVKRRQGYAVVCSGNLTITCSNDKTSQPVWGKIKELFNSNPRLLGLSAMQCKQKG